MKQILIKINGEWKELAGSICYQEFDEKTQSYVWKEVVREDIEDAMLNNRKFNKEDLRKIIDDANAVNLKLAQEYKEGIKNIK